MKTYFQMLIVMLLMDIPAPGILAHPANGLWHNDRDHITIRIEADGKGIRTKQLDEGTWHFYKQQKHGRYKGQHGQSFKWRKDNTLIWHRGHGRKDLFFRKEADVSRKNHRHYSLPINYGHQRKNHTAAKARHPENHPPISIGGQWCDPGGNMPIEVKIKSNGIKVRQSQGRWSRFDGLYKNVLYSNRHGDVIQVINPHMLQWTNRKSGQIKRYFR
jgi:hypothetical protein